MLTTSIMLQLSFSILESFLGATPPNREDFFFQTGFAVLEEEKERKSSLEVVNYAPRSSEREREKNGRLRHKTREKEGEKRELEGKIFFLSSSSHSRFFCTTLAGNNL